MTKKAPIIYIAFDGTKFTDAVKFLKYDRAGRRQAYYNYLLSKRNWLERLFNIKPNMDFYDSNI